MINHLIVKIKEDRQFNKYILDTYVVNIYNLYADDINAQIIKNNIIRVSYKNVIYFECNSVFNNLYIYNNSCNHSYVYLGC